MHSTEAKDNQVKILIKDNNPPLVVDPDLSGQAGKSYVVPLTKLHLDHLIVKSAFPNRSLGMRSGGESELGSDQLFS